VNSTTLLASRTGGWLILKTLVAGRQHAYGIAQYLATKARESSWNDPALL